MKKLLWISALCILCGMVLLSSLTGVGKVRASTLVLQPVQIQNSGFTDSKGTITVTATCPQNYHVQNGSVQITPSNQSQAYAISANGPDAQNNTWTTTVENKMAGSMSITITVTCAQKA